MGQCGGSDNVMKPPLLSVSQTILCSVRTNPMAESVIISLQTWGSGVKPIFGIIVVDESSNLFNGFLSHFQNDWSEDVICWFVVDGKFHGLFCVSVLHTHESMWRLSLYQSESLGHQCEGHTSWGLQLESPSQSVPTHHQSVHTTFRR